MQALNWKICFTHNVNICVYHGHFVIDNKSRLYPNKKMYGMSRVSLGLKISACKEMKQNKTNPWGSASVPFTECSSLKITSRNVPIIQNVQTVLRSLPLVNIFNKLAVLCTASVSAALAKQFGLILRCEIALGVFVLVLEPKARHLHPLLHQWR